MTGVTLVVLAAGVGERFGGLKQLAPVGPGGEALMDYSIHGAVEAGCQRVVVVVRSEIDEAIRDHFRTLLPDRPGFDFVEQPVRPSGKPAGTAMAVMACRAVLGNDPFIVINSDDLYLPPVLSVLVRWLSGSGTSHALVGFPLGLTVLPGSGPVTRAVCRRRHDGALDELIESNVERKGEGFVGHPVSGGHDMVLSASQLVSMNAWGFRSSVWSGLEPVVERMRVAAAPDAEVFLPVAVTGLSRSSRLSRRDVDVTVLPVDVPCFGVTWAEDLEALREQVQALIESGVYPRRL